MINYIMAHSLACLVGILLGIYWVKMEKKLDE